MLGFLGFSSINLDLATCTIAAIILGIAIDDTIHILYRYQREKKEGLSEESALKITHFHIGRVVVLTSLLLFVGFSILLLASLKTVFYFGLLSIISVIAVFYGDIIILTLLLKRWKWLTFISWRFWRRFFCQYGSMPQSHIILKKRKPSFVGFNILRQMYPRDLWILMVCQMNIKIEINNIQPFRNSQIMSTIYNVTWTKSMIDIILWRPDETVYYIKDNPCHKIPTNKP